MEQTNDDRTKPLGSGFGAQTTGEEALGGRNLREKVALVTGGHSGIDLETKRVLSKAGATVVVGARDVKKARANLEKIGERGSDPARSRQPELHRQLCRCVSEIEPAAQYPHPQRGDFEAATYQARARLRNTVCDEPPGTLPTDRETMKPAQ